MWNLDTELCLSSQMTKHTHTQHNTHTHTTKRKHYDWNDVWMWGGGYETKHGIRLKWPEGERSLLARRQQQGALYQHLLPYSIFYITLIHLSVCLSIHPSFHCLCACLCIHQFVISGVNIPVRIALLILNPIFLSLCSLPAHFDGQIAY